MPPKNESKKPAEEADEDVNVNFNRLTISDPDAPAAGAGAGAASASSAASGSAARSSKKKQHIAQINEEATDHVDDLPEHPFYVHIDVVANPLQLNLAGFINSYMLRRFYFDPRRYFNFFDDVFAPEIPTLTDMRTACRMSRSYYELWKVKRDFNAQTFFNAFDNAFPEGGFSIRVCLLLDGEHQILSRVY